MTWDLDGVFASNHAEEAEVPDCRLFAHRIGLLMELPVQVAFAEPVYHVLKLGLSGMLLKMRQYGHKHTDLIVADIVCLTALGLGVVRQTDLIVCTLPITDRSAEDAHLTDQP